MRAQQKRCCLYLPRAVITVWLVPWLVWFWLVIAAYASVHCGFTLRCDIPSGGLGRWLLPGLQFQGRMVDWLPTFLVHVPVRLGFALRLFSGWYPCALYAQNGSA